MSQTRSTLLLPTALILAALCSLGPRARSQSHVGLENLGATLWVQKSSEYRAVCRSAFSLAKIRLDEALRDATWTAALEQEGKLDTLPKTAKTAVVLDLDETVLDNSPYQARLVLDGREFDIKTWSDWVKEAQAEAIMGALDFCQYARSKGVMVFYLSNRSHERVEETKRNLIDLKFPVDSGPNTFLLRTDTSDKAARRARAAEQHRILLLIGDNQADFSSEFRKKSTQASLSIAERYRARWGKSWIMLPNPTYGSWLNALKVPGGREARLEGLLAALDPRRAQGPGSTSRTLPLFAEQAVHPKLRAGPMNAWTAIYESCVWLQTKEAASAQIRYWPQGKPTAARLSQPVLTEESSDHIARFDLKALEAGTTYSYEVYLDGDRVNLPHTVRFTTQKIWRYRTQAPDLRFLVGSCLYVNDPPSDRPGAPYGGDHELLLQAATEKPDFMLWLGDNCYYRETDWLSPEGLRSRHRKTRAFPMLQPLLGITQHYAIWDDHDFGPNNSDRSFGLKEHALSTFKSYWPQPQMGKSDAPGCYYRFTWADAEFFMLDNRYHRSPNDAPDDANKTMFGKMQLEWLLSGLTNSNATFKFIAAGNQMTNPMTFFEAFGNYSHEQKKLFDYIAKNQIGGVIFLSGDRHAGELLRYKQEGARGNWYELTSSPLGAGAGRYEPEKDNPIRVDGTWTTNVRHYCVVSLHGSRDKRRVTFSAHDKTGKELWRHMVEAKELW